MGEEQQQDITRGILKAVAIIAAIVVSVLLVIGAIHGLATEPSLHR